MNCPCNCGTLYSLTGVTTNAKIVLDVSLTYSSSCKDKTVTISPGELYTFTYLEDGQLKNCSGRVTNIYKVEELERETGLYKIRVDCSSTYSNNVVVFKTDQIRGVERYYQYAAEDSTISNGYQENGTTIARLIRDAVVVDAELDAEKNLIKGTIVAGVVENGTTIDGVVIGTNPQGHDILVVNPQSTGGELSSGLILNGVVRSGDIDGETEEGTGMVINATVKGIIANVVIVNSKVSGVQVPNGKGTVIEPVLKESVVYDATVTGEDMVTTGGVTIGNITTGGVTEGGTANGGTAYGSIDGKPYTITDGETSGDISTTDGVVVGGVIVGGTKVGNAIYNATVKGGVCTRGITTGGTTSIGISVKAYKAGAEGRFFPSKQVQNTGVVSRIAKAIHDNPNYNHLEAELLKENRWSMNSDDLVLATDRVTGTQLYTNFGRANLEYVDQWGREHKD